ncbi:MAG: tetratricopeptide repeat protein [Gammaproteobacteria bacterium]
MRIAGTSRILCALLVAALAVPTNGASLDPIKQQLRAGKYQRGLDLVDQYLKQQPDDVAAQLMRAELLRQLGRAQSAIQVLTTLIESQPEVTEAYNNLAAIQAEQGQLDEARATLERGIKSDKTFATLHGNLTEIYGKMAQEAYGKALELKAKQSRPELAVLLEVEARPDTSNRDIPTAEPQRLAQAPLAAPPAPKARSQVNSPKPAVSVSKPPELLVEPPADEVSYPAAPEDEPELIPSIPSLKTVSSVDETNTAASKTDSQAVYTTDQSAVSEPVPTTAPTSLSEAEVDAAPSTSNPAAVRTVGPIRRLLGWARAWARQDVDAYIGFYAPDYSPPGRSRASWVALRKKRLTKPEWITVELNEFRAKTLGGNQVEIEFRQVYTNDRFVSKARKKVIMVNHGNGWLITSEEVTESE